MVFAADRVDTHPLGRLAASDSSDRIDTGSIDFRSNDGCWWSALLGGAIWYGIETEKPLNNKPSAATLAPTEEEKAYESQLLSGMTNPELRQYGRSITSEIQKYADNFQKQEADMMIKALPYPVRAG